MWVRNDWQPILMNYDFLSLFNIPRLHKKRAMVFWISKDNGLSIFSKEVV